MTDLSYTDAGQPAPAAGTPRGFGYFRSIFDYMFSKINSHWNNTTPVNQHNSGAILANDSAHALTTVRALTGNTQFTENDMMRRMFLELLDGDFTAATFAARVVPNTIKAMNTTLAAASSTSVAGALAKWDAVTGGLTLPASLIATLVSDYKPSANASPGVITIAAGGAYESTTGVVVGPLVQQTASLPTQPTGTNFQYVGISLSPSTGTPVITAAAVNAALSTLVMPTANKPVAVVLWRGVTTLPSGIVAAADIIDIRNLGGGGGSAGSGGVATTDPAVSFGTLGSLLDIYTLLNGTAGSGVVNGHDKANLRTALTRIGTEDPALVANAPTLDNLLGHSSGGIELRPQDYITISGNSITISPNAAAPYPATIFFPNGTLKKLIAPKMHTVTPASGYSVYAIVADCTNPTFSTDGTFDFQLLSPPPSSFSATQKLLGFAINDSTKFLGIDYAAFEPMLQVSSTQMTPITEAIAVAPGSAYTSTSVAGAPVTITEGTKVLVFPRTMKVKVRGSIRITAATGVHLYGGLFIDGILLGELFDLGLNTTAAWDLTVPMGGAYGTSSDHLSLPAGVHTVTVKVYTYAVSTAFTVQSIAWESEQWGVFN